MILREPLLLWQIIVACYVLGALLWPLVREPLPFDEDYSI